MDIQQAYQLEDIIRIGIALIILLSGFLAVFYVLWGGVSLILSGGKEEKIKPALNSIRFAVLGLLVIILSIFVLPKVGDLLGLGIAEYVSPNVIFDEIKTLSNTIFSGEGASPNPANSGASDVPSDFSDL